jgi:hypothetical protein
MLLIFTVTTFALAAPIAPEDTITVLGKRVIPEDLSALWEIMRHNRNAMEHAPPPNVPAGELQMTEVHMPPPKPAGVQEPEAHMPPLKEPEVYMPPPNLAGVQEPEVHDATESGVHVPGP